MYYKRKTVKLFYKGELYKFFEFSSKKDALEWMSKETQLMPVSKKHLYYFQMPLIMPPTQKSKV